MIAKRLVVLSHRHVFVVVVSNVETMRVITSDWLKQYLMLFVTVEMKKCLTVHLSVNSMEMLLTLISTPKVRTYLSRKCSVCCVFFWAFLRFRWTILTSIKRKKSLVWECWKRWWILLTTVTLIDWFLVNCWRVRYRCL